MSGEFETLDFSNIRMKIFIEFDRKEGILRFHSASLRMTS